MGEQYNPNNQRRDNSDAYYFAIEGNLVEQGKSKVESIAEVFSRDNITASVVSHIPDQHSEFANVTNGKNFEFTGHFGEDIADFIIKRHTPSSYRIITANNYKRITLKEPIKPNYKEEYKKIKNFPMYREKILNTYADSDSDGLLDLEEIRYAFNNTTDIVNWTETGELILPTMEDCLRFKNGRNYIKEQYKNYNFKDAPIRILPLYSNPTEEDSDCDGINDYLDAKPLKKFNDKYIIVDSLEYEPKIDYLENEMKNSELCYDSILTEENFYEDCYHKILPYLLEGSLYEVGMILGCICGYTPFVQPVVFKTTDFGSMPNASKMYCHYLLNTGDVYELSQIDMINILNSKPSNYAHFNYNLDLMKEAAESMLGRDGHLCISTSPKCDFIGACYSSDICDGKAEKKYKNTPLYSITDVDLVRDYSYTIGNANCAIVIDVTLKNGVYSYKYVYYILDFYNWDWHKTHGDYEQHLMHELGWAKEFYVKGSITGEGQWLKGTL